MKCPVDGTELRMTERQGVEIDYCPHCRGVWLDRGELDKLIERADDRRDRDDDDYDDDDRYDRRRGDRRDSPPGQQPRKRESFWGRVFDFD